MNTYLHNKQKQENTFKNKLTQFFTPYPTPINSPFNFNHFNFISTYFKNNSSIYTSIKTN
ncbi:TcaA NTF2-like domain-containing protein, partial [Staphylococcus epidermidis]|uniref:TcaA NTF2-like domain-containing protein n=1 Tax=Staphylococcus epidermidis TaxID=1282 RepID=UPI003F68A3BF